MLELLAIYAVITYMDCVSGVYFPEGGMHAVPTAMARVLGESGADLRYAAPVGEILRDASGRVAGVTAAGEKIAAGVLADREAQAANQAFERERGDAAEVPAEPSVGRHHRPSRGQGRQRRGRGRGAGGRREHAAYSSPVARGATTAGTTGAEVAGAGAMALGGWLTKDRAGQIVRAGVTAEEARSGFETTTSVSRLRAWVAT